MNQKSLLTNLPIHIYADGPTLEEIQILKHNVDGFTFNPSLFRKLKIKNYLEHCKKLIEKCGELPISLEVFADELNEMVTQAKILSRLSENVYVKIPITFTNGMPTTSVLEQLTDYGIKLNITAVFTLRQVKNVLPVLNESNAIISIFAGRIYDIGLDAFKITKQISNYIHNNSNCKILWASPRMVYDIISASKSNCDIITMQPSLINKLPLLNKTAEDYSLDTVKMFYDDAMSSGYEM